MVATASSAVFVVSMSIQRIFFLQLLGIWLVQLVQPPTVSATMRLVYVMQEKFKKKKGQYALTILWMFKGQPCETSLFLLSYSSLIAIALLMEYGACHQLEKDSGRPFSFSLTDPELPTGTLDFSSEDITVPSEDVT